MKFKKLFISALAVSTISLAASSTYATDYEINHGDTLWQIAQKYNTTVENLARINNIQNINLIYAGHKLKIDDEQILVDVTPSTVDSSASISTNTIHTVSLGDTLTNIAKRYNTTVAQLQLLNNISNPHLIYIGQAIRVEGSAFISSEDEITIENVDNIEIPKTLVEEKMTESEVKEEVSVVKETATDTETQKEEVKATETTNQTEETKVAESAPQTEETKAAEAARQAEEAKAAEAARQAEEAKAAESARQAEEAKAMTTVDNAINGNSIVSNAYAIAPQRVYSYGANDSYAVDCSSFVQQVYAASGISIPRVTWAQMSAGTPTSDPQPGDLVFFNGGSHVGIYVGNGMMIDALNAGTPIGERPISSIIGSVDGYYTFR